ncbi:MAG: 23S rRNA (adenine(2503)-C(2))-methyltransferase RlmN [bacterium]
MLAAITDIPIKELPSAMEGMGLKKYVAAQLINWLYVRLASSFEEMTDLSKEARALLAERYSISAVRVGSMLSAEDGTAKLCVSAADGNSFECVLIPSDDGRVTACLSTQAGCAMGCAFCRTAEMGFIRDLTQGEIVGQFVELARMSKSPITNVVLMGMGEPLANVENVLSAIEIFKERRAFNISKRRITVSTSGLIPELREFVKRSEVRIAISLNATTDEVRDRIMPVNRRSPIAEIMEFAREYGATSRLRITFEYVMLRGVNDSMDDARRLVGLLAGCSAKLNLIPFNPYEGSEFAAPDPLTVERWSEYLHDKGVQVNIRSSRGREIMAACGQLVSENRDS